MNEEKQAQCGICLEDMLPATIYTLECHHNFHRTCITSWFQSEIHLHHPLTCPFCRRNCHFPSEDKNNNNNNPSSPLFPNFSQEQLKRLLRDGIVSMNLLLESELFLNYPVLRNMSTRIRRVLQLHYVKQQVHEYFRDPNYNWKKLCFVMVSGVLLDVLFHE